jgi:hypothetical protein
MSQRLADSFGLRGRVELVALNKRTGKVLSYQKLENIILYQGNAEIIKALCQSSPVTYPRIITRMAIGDDGTIPSDSTVPKVPVKTQSGLFHEIYRKDADAFAITTSGSTNECRFTATFDAANSPLTSFSNPSQPRVNEVGLVIIDPSAGAGLVRPPVVAPAAPAVDEVVMSVRTFKSIPFDVANDVTITIRYTVFLT